jgi:hypothetical protein
MTEIETTHTITKVWLTIHAPNIATTLRKIHPQATIETNIGGIPLEPVPHSSDSGSKNTYFRLLHKQRNIGYIELADPVTAKEIGDVSRTATPFAYGTISKVDLLPKGEKRKKKQHKILAL